MTAVKWMVQLEVKKYVDHIEKWEVNTKDMTDNC